MKNVTLSIVNPSVGHYGHIVGNIAVILGLVTVIVEPPGTERCSTRMVESPRVSDGTAVWECDLRDCSICRVIRKFVTLTVGIVNLVDTNSAGGRVCRWYGAICASGLLVSTHRIIRTHRRG